MRGERRAQEFQEEIITGQVDPELFFENDCMEK